MQFVVDKYRYLFKGLVGGIISTALINVPLLGMLVVLGVFRYCIYFLNWKKPANGLNTVHCGLQ